MKFTLGFIAGAVAMLAALLAIASHDVIGWDMEVELD